MQEKITHFLLGIIAICLIGLLLRETAPFARAQPSARVSTDGQPQISSGNGMVYVLMNRKVYVYMLESKETKRIQQSVGLDVGDLKLIQKSVIDLPAAH